MDPAPCPGDPHATRERLLSSAERLFAARGYDATSVRDITRAAGCNLAAVSYHFRGKEDLYREVLQQRLASLRARRIAVIRDALLEADGARRLEAVLAAFAAEFVPPLLDASGQQVVVELIARELLDPRLPAGFLLEVFGPVQETLFDALRQAVPGLPAEAARLSGLSLIGQLVHFATAMRHRDRIARLPASPAIFDHIVRFTAAGIRAAAAPEGRSPA